MVIDAPRQELPVRREPKPAMGGPVGLREDIRTLIVSLAWGLGDVLLSTSAVREYKRLNPDVRILYHTYKNNRGTGYSTMYGRGSPGELLQENPDIDYVLDWKEPINVDGAYHIAKLKYAWFGGPSLDYPIQAHYWENLGLAWVEGQRFDAVYVMTEGEREWARTILPESGGPYLALTPETGWAGKAWTEKGWGELIAWALGEGLHPVILSGKQERSSIYHRRGVLNMGGAYNMRETAALLERIDEAVMTEGGLSNLRFALGRPVNLLTCATQVGVTLWTPPELTTEIRWLTDNEAFYPSDEKAGVVGIAACEPCMWRGEHVKYNRADVPPANIGKCPKGISLRDMPASVVIAALTGA